MHRFRRTLISSSFVAAIAALGLSLPAHSQQLASAQTQAPAHAAIEGSRSPVLVELFTSEGCSDCPPADALLAQLDTRQPIPGADVIILELHVSYWNDDWRDPFSSMSYTDRQHMYAYGHSDQMYTPQMIVDGGDRFIGSNGQAAVKAIQQAARAPKAPIELQWSGAANGNDRVLHVKVASLPQGDPDKPQIFLAITESHLHVDVHAGENHGKSLDHDGVVRKLAAIGKIQSHSGDPIFDTQTQVKLEKDWKPENVRAVVFVQDPHSLRVLGAAEIPFSD